MKQTLMKMVALVSAVYRVLFIVYCLLFIAPPAHAAISSATASIDTVTMTKNASIQIWFTIRNTDSVGIRYIKINRPSSELTIVGGGTGWSMSQDESSLTITGQPLSPGDKLDVRVDVESGSSAMSAVPWVVQVSDVTNGSNFYTATGDLDFTVSGEAPDIRAPNIANVSLSTTDTSFAVSWTTDEATNGTLQYGTTNSYGYTKEATAFTRNHSLTATALSQDTTYYFSIESADASGNTANSYESFLVTSDVQPTATLTITPTPTSGPGATPSPTPMPDTIEPISILHAVSQSRYSTIPTLHITASDERGVANVFYSVNNGAYIRIPGVGSSTSRPIDAVFTPKHARVTGNYRIQIKATDSAGNIGMSEARSYVLDSEGPKLLFSTAFAPIMTSIPVIRGTVIDPSGIASIEYSLDSGKTWTALPSKVTEYGVEFETDIRSENREGRYSFMLRATDSVGNSTTAPAKTFILDRLPPKSGGILVAHGTIPLLPVSKSHMVGMKNHAYTIYVSTLGGVTASELILTRAGGKKDRLAMKHSTRYDMWEATFSPTISSVYEVSVELTDGVNPIVASDLFRFEIQEPSCITGNGQEKSMVSVFTKDTVQQRFLLWNASAFDQINPVQASSDACYSFLLPKGTYRLQASGFGYRSIDSEVFDIPYPTFVSVPFHLEKARCFSFWTIIFCSPFHRQIPVNALSGSDDNNKEVTSPIALNPVATPELLQLISGKAIQVILINTWMPDSMSYLSRLENQKATGGPPIVVVVPYEPENYVKAWKKELGFSFPIVADPDGSVAESVNYHFGPLELSSTADGIVTEMQIVKNNENDVQLK